MIDIDDTSFHAPRHLFGPNMLSQALRGASGRFRRALPELHCRVLGHVVTYRVGGHYVDRHGRWQDKYYGRCRRCGCGSPACYELGLVERLKEGWRDLRHRIRARLWDDCIDCGRPASRLGAAIGDHRDCLPF